MPQSPYYPTNKNLGTLATLTAASASGVCADQTNVQWRGVVVSIDVTAITGTSPDLVVTVQGKDPVSGVYYTLLASASITAAGFSTLTVYPNAPATANVSEPLPLPYEWRVIYTIGGTTPAVTATIGAVVIV